MIAQHSGVARQPRDRDTDMIIDLDQLLLVRRELAGRAFERQEDRMRLGSQSDSCGTLLDGFLGVFHLMQATLWGLRSGDGNMKVYQVPGSMCAK